MSPLSGSHMSDHLGKQIISSSDIINPMWHHTHLDFHSWWEKGNKPLIYCMCVWVCVPTESWKPKRTSWIWLMDVESKSRSSFSLEMVAAITRLSGEWMKSRRMQMICLMCSMDSWSSSLLCTHIYTHREIKSIYVALLCGVLQPSTRGAIELFISHHCYKHTWM